MSAVPHSLQPGVYQAALTIDAGPMAGSKTVAVTFTVTSGPPNYQAPLVAAVVNAATNQLGPIQAGSIATVWGDRLSPTPTVKFDGMSKPPCCANRPLYLSKLPMLILLAQAAPIANWSVSWPM